MFNQSWVLLITVLVLGIANVTLIVVVIVGRVRAGSQGDSITKIGERLATIDRISDDLEALSKLFMIPHARGGFGETMLNELLRSWLPAGSYILQHTFADGARVDAVIKLSNYLIPVDAKFPLESLRPVLEQETGGGALPADARRALRKHVEAIRSRYIRPEEGTLHFALMYIPSERVYYHAFVAESGGALEEAVRSGVVPVGPGGLFLYLQTVAYGLRGLALQGRRRELLELFTRSYRELQELGRAFGTAGTHLKNLSRSHDEIRGRLHRLDASLAKLKAFDADDE